MDNQEEMDKLKQYNLLRLNQEEKLQNTNRPITRNEIESVVLKFPINKRPGPDGFTGEFYQIFKEDLIFFFSKYSKDSKRKSCFQTHSTRPALP